MDHLSNIGGSADRQQVFF